jgi:hypothetical protein
MYSKSSFTRLISDRCKKRPSAHSSRHTEKEGGVNQWPGSGSHWNASHSAGAAGRALLMAAGPRGQCREGPGNAMLERRHRSLVHVPFFMSRRTRGGQSSFGGSPMQIRASPQRYLKYLSPHVRVTSYSMQLFAMRLPSWNPRVGTQCDAGNTKFS